MRVLVLGGASYDDIIQVEEFIQPVSQNVFAKESFSAIGSTGVGKALAFKKLGYDVDFIAVIGNDFYGEEIKKAMDKSSINFYPIYADKTERHTNIHNSLGERISIFTQIPEVDIISVHKYDALIKEADFIVLNIKQYCKEFIQVLKNSKKPVYCDIHDYNGKEIYHKDFIDVSDYIFLSSDKLFNYKLYMEELIDNGKKWVVCTHAEKGATALFGEEFTDIDADKIEIVDTNGAGDNFFVGFVHGYLNNYSVKESLLLGKIVANTCIKSRQIVLNKLSLEYISKMIKKL